jgi:lipopolysaccharide cholinephosphotransferase
MRELTLEEIKKVELGILDDFARICDENGLRYYLAYGTLIGAMRHKGFIPWDDDVDVMMPLPDYLKFLELFKDQSGNERFVLVDRTTDKSCRNPFAKYMDNNTVAYISGIRNSVRVWIDIFPMTGLDNDEDKRKELLKKVKKKNRLCQYGDAKIVFETSWVRMAAKAILFFPLRVLKGKICDSIIKEAFAYDYNDYDYVDHVVSSQNLRMNRKEWFDYGRKAEFEGKMYSIPKEAEKVLELNYGDYMKLPPVEERVSNHGLTAYMKN